LIPNGSPNENKVWARGDETDKSRLKKIHKRFQREHLRGIGKGDDGAPRVLITGRECSEGLKKNDGAQIQISGGQIYLFEKRKKKVIMGGGGRPIRFLVTDIAVGEEMLPGRGSF